MTRSTRFHGGIMGKLKKNRIEGEFDATGTLSRVASPGQFSGAPEEKAAAPVSYVDIEHGGGPVGLKKIGKKFLHIKRALKKRYDRTK